MLDALVLAALFALALLAFLGTLAHHQFERQLEEHALRLRDLEHEIDLLRPAVRSLERHLTPASPPPFPDQRSP
jgi:type II secretory pathway component PulJ